MLKILTFAFDKYEVSKFICRKTLGHELYRVRESVSEVEYQKIYTSNKDKIDHIIEESYPCSFDVDLVIPYVNNTDPVWQKAYVESTGRKDYLNNVRFDHPDMFEYFLRGVDKFMPWIRKIHLIVSNPEQVPSYINKEKTHIVLHKDIMPENILPTFNSSTIEMFISKIEGLSEHFIYSNDDMYPIAPLEKSDFFSKDGKPKVVFKRLFVRPTMSFFNNLCLNVYNHTSEVLGIPYDNKSFLRPEHTMASLILSHCKDCLDKMWHFVKEDLGPFRTTKQHTQYMYSLYERFTDNYVFDGPAFVYHDLSFDSNAVEQEIKHHSCKILCLNGSPGVTEESLDRIRSAFEENLKK